MKIKYFLLSIILFFSLSVFAQDKKIRHKNAATANHLKPKVHHTLHRKKNKANAPRVTGIKYTGSSDGTMPNNDNPGKITTSPKGKTHASNGLVRIRVKK